MFTALVERKRKEGLVVYERLHYGKQIFPLVRSWNIKYISCICLNVYKWISRSQDVLLFKLLVTVMML